MENNDIYYKKYLKYKIKYINLLNNSQSNKNMIEQTSGMNKIKHLMKKGKRRVGELIKQGERNVNQFNKKITNTLESVVNPNNFIKVVDTIVNPVGTIITAIDDNNNFNNKKRNDIRNLGITINKTIELINDLCKIYADPKVYNKTLIDYIISRKNNIIENLEKISTTIQLYKINI